MGLSKERWNYLKNMPGHTYTKVSKPPRSAYMPKRGRRPKESYRGMRMNSYRKEDFKVKRYARKERWQYMRNFGVSGL